MDVFDLLRVSFIGKGRGVQVAVSRVAEGGDADLEFFLEPFDLGEGLGKLAPGNGGVFEDRRRRNAGDSRQGGPTGGGEAGGFGGVLLRSSGVEGESLSMKIFPD